MDVMVAMRPVLCGLDVWLIKYGAGLEAEELGVNIACRQAHQPEYRRPDPLSSTSCKRQSI
ncbi:hypothetical protein Taro_030750 [Colocasia esculenta]|uniref:Uncharacterized protein n=1 Tax=Colocasia esculenta TaxID=4460 RepID=A0A843VM65_COLES|nr:hypothetical protein [Colocasia esculenta]